MSDHAAESPARPLRERLRRWMRPPRRLAFTRAGKFFVLITLGIGFGAVNTGNNLLFLLLGMMLSLIIASGMLSEAVIRKLAARRRAPKRIFAGIPAAGGFRLQNDKSYASLSVEVAEQNLEGLSGPLKGRHLGPDHVPWWKFWSSTATDGALNARVASAYRMRVEAADELDLDARYLVPQRGVYKLPGINLTTRFPFSFFEKIREIDAPERLVVFPQPRDADEWIATIAARFGDVSQNKRGMGEEYFGLREYRPGEDTRLIHWKSSARRGETVLRETEQQEQRSVEIWLMSWSGRPPQQRHLAAPRFERGLEHVAGLILRLVSAGYRVGLRTLDEALSPAEDAAGVDRMLATLATCHLLDEHEAFDAAPAPRSKTGRILIGLEDAIDHTMVDADLRLTMDTLPDA